MGVPAGAPPSPSTAPRGPSSAARRSRPKGPGRRGHAPAIGRTPADPDASALPTVYPAVLRHGRGAAIRAADPALAPENAQPGHFRDWRRQELRPEAAHAQDLQPPDLHRAVERCAVARCRGDRPRAGTWRPRVCLSRLRRVCRD